MRKISVLLRVIGFLILGTPMVVIAPANAQAVSGELPAPKGLNSCLPSDPIAVAETHVAETIGGEFLGCFRSDKKTIVPGASKPAPVPLEYAFTISLPGGPYTSAKLDEMLSVVTNQWKNFQPLGREFHENYIARLNALMKDVYATPATVSSIKPTLVSIDRLDAKSYSVVSIRSYVFDVNGKQIGAVRVNADGIVLRGSELIRLTIQRTLTGAQDVGALQKEIAEWARATEGDTSLHDPKHA